MQFIPFNILKRISGSDAHTITFKGILCFVLIFFLHHSVAAQSPVLKDTLTPSLLFRIVQEHHPLMKIGDLKLAQGAAALLSAKGGFDPVIDGDFVQKEFDRRLYFQHLEGGLSVPTSIVGLQLQAGFEQHTGQYLNPEFQQPPGGVYYAGVKLPLAQGLMFDQRRAQRNTGRILLENASATRQAIANNLLYESTLAYLDWVSAHWLYNIIRDATNLARERLQFVRGSVAGGDRAAIDTLEAFIQIQTLEADLSQAAMFLQNSQYALSNFLWRDDSTTLVPDQHFLAPSDPTSILFSYPASTIQNWLDQHPDIRMMDYSIAQLDIQRRLLAESLKPQVDVHFNLLTGVAGDAFVGNISFVNNKWGVRASFPLFLRKARGDLNLNRAVTREMYHRKSMLRNELNNRSLRINNEVAATFDQYATLRAAADNLERLLKAEQNRFGQGESALFIVNARQTNLLNTQRHMIDRWTRANKARIALYWTEGRLGQGQ